jgi:ATP-dependent DNA helicase RecG
MYNVALNGLQSALMAPTEILATQHYFNLHRLLQPFNISHALLTGSQKYLNGEKIKAQELLEKIKSGEVPIIIGTHALIQKSVNFSNLGLVVIDEQHRFGVKQRQILKEKNPNHLTPHFLSLTATPIPRSLSLVMFGDLDISLIKQMPAGRKAVKTKIVPTEQRFDAYSFINDQITQGRQVFVVCPLIDPSDKMGFKSVIEEHKKLDQDIFPDISVGLLHGRLKGDEKEAIMGRFKDNEIKILVSTSVVEVGVDIPNATVMMIEGADRFGLAQLHQFRGRVGRSEHQSYCFLFSESDDPKTLDRLNFLASCSDGFKLAEYDLEVRGSGNIFSEEQSGFINFLKVADFMDVASLKKVRQSVDDFLSGHQLKDFPQLEERIKNLGSLLHLE